MRCALSGPATPILIPIPIPLLQRSLRSGHEIRSPFRVSAVPCCLVLEIAEQRRVARREARESAFLDDVSRLYFESFGLELEFQNIIFGWEE